MSFYIYLHVLLKIISYVRFYSTRKSRSMLFFSCLVFGMAQEDNSMEDISPPGEDEYFVEDKECQTEVEMEISQPDDHSDEVQKVTGEFKNLNTTETMETDKPKVIIIAPFPIPEKILNQKEAGITWTSIPRTSIEAVTNKILEELKEKNQVKHITVCAYQPFLATHDSATIEKNLSKVTRAVIDSRLHKLSLATFFHIPSEEKIWEKVSMLNQHQRLLNLDMSREPNNAHKSLLFSFNQGRVCYIRYNVWKERMDKTGVGNTLNEEGLTRYKNYLLKYIRGNGFNDEQGVLVRAIGGDGSPAPLCFTRGYKGNKQMMDFIESLGLRMPSKPKGDNRTDLQKRVENYRSAAKKFAEESKVNEKVWESESEKQRDKDRKENRMKGKERLEARDRKRQEDKEYQLSQEVKNLKLESLRARSRSKSKYQEFERTIDRLKDKLQQRERMVTDLRRDLARAEVDCEEWKELAGKARNYDRGPKRARRN